MRNRTGVEWTRLGALSGPSRLLVDGRGFLVVEGAGWGVDWWIGADDRWHVPAVEAAVRQTLVGHAPVVQTAVRVPGGDVLQRVAVVAGPAGPRAVVEVANDSAAPVALALAVRPVTMLEVGAVHDVGLHGATVDVDGAAALLLPERPSRTLLTTADDGDPLPLVTGGAAPVSVDGTRTCRQGLAGAVVVVPIAHRATYRWQLTLDATTLDAPRRVRSRRPRRSEPSAADVGAAHDPSAVPDTAAVARGWTAQVERLVRLDLPPSPAIDLVPAVRAHLLQAAGGAGAGPEVAAAAATAGFGVADPDELLVAALAALPGDGDGGGLGAVLWAAGLLVGLGAALPPARRVAMAAEELARAQAAGPAHLAGPGLEAAATLLDQRSEQRAAATARAWAAAAPAGPARGGQDADSTGGVWRPADLAAGAQVVALTGSPDWLVVLARLVATARPTAVWPDLLDPLTGGGCGVDGHDPVVTARYWSTLRSALLADDDGGVDLLPAWPPAWRAAPVEAHQLPSRHGLVSFALRWHGDRPALLWSVDGATGPLVVRASGPAPSWSSTDAAGEVLLPRVPSDVGPGSVQGS